MAARSKTATPKRKPARRKKPPAPVFAPPAGMRFSVFHDATLRAGVAEFRACNNMWMPAVYVSAEEDDNCLNERVALVDCSSRCHVEITGTDADLLVRLMSPLGVSGWDEGRCRYHLLCDGQGGIVNDPVGLKLSDDRYLFSSAATGLYLWIAGLAAGAGFDVHVEESDTALLQVQGPASPALMSDVAGSWIDGLADYDFEVREILDAPVIISRSGWSNQHGYEIFLRDTSCASEFWDHLMSAGKPYGLSPCGVSLARRLEAGVPAYGIDMDRSNNPFELRLDHLVDLDRDDDFVGKGELARIRRTGVERLMASFLVDGPPMAPDTGHWPVTIDGEPVGTMTSAAWSQRRATNLALGLVRPAFVAPGIRVSVDTPQGKRMARAVPTPFTDTGRRN